MNTILRRQLKVCARITCRDPFLSFCLLLQRNFTGLGRNRYIALRNIDREILEFKWIIFEAASTSTIILTYFRTSSKRRFLTMFMSRCKAGKIDYRRFTCINVNITLLHFMILIVQINIVLCSCILTLFFSISSELLKLSFTYSASIILSRSQY